MDSDKKREFRALGITLIHFVLLIIPIKHHIEKVKVIQALNLFPLPMLKKSYYSKEKPKPPVKKKVLLK